MTLTDGSQLSSFVIIPARLASTRLPGKLLLRETGKSVLQHTFEAALRAQRPVGVCVAAADDDIAKEVLRFGGVVERTDAELQSGTDRVAVVASQPRFSGIDIIVNLQGDEPEISHSAIDQLVELLDRDRSAVMATLATPIRQTRQFLDPACVKVVCDGRGQAMYFSRAPIPHVRDGDAADPPTDVLQHLGLYAYRREFLLQLAKLPRTPLERLENLEQLRVLESGYSIAVGIIDEATRGIDTEDDYRAFVQRQRSA